MKILITNPYCWPYVRRGSERFLAELSEFLACRGNDVTVLSTSPNGDEEERTRAGVRIVRALEINPPLLHRFNLVRPETGFALVCYRFLQQNSFDVMHCLYHADVLGALSHHAGRHIPCVLHLTGIPFGRWIRRHPWETAMTRTAIRRASRVILISRHAADQFRKLFPQHGAKAVSIGIPSRLESFSGQNFTRDVDRPVILFMSTLAEFRKGAQPLAYAFNQVKQQIPGARLWYCGSVTDVIKMTVLECVRPEFRSDVEFLGPGRVEDVPAMYAQAAVTVLPAVEEAFGMVLVESLASGTPVVGSSDAGMSDIIQPGTGGLVDPLPKNGVATNVMGFADQIVAAIRLHADLALPERCRKSAQRFSWERLGPQFEALYDECVNRSPTRV